MDTQSAGPVKPSDSYASRQREEFRVSKRRWMSEFHVAFALMSVIPLLICLYLLTVKFFSLAILEGLNGVYLLLAVILALLGLLVGREVIRNVIHKLVETNERTERFQATQTEFVSHVAHEFRSPLAIVKGALENLRDGLHGSLSQDQGEPIAMSIREVSRLTRVVGDLLDIGQIESGGLCLQQETLVLQDLLRDIARSCLELSKEQGLTLAVDLPEAPVKILGDRDRLGQVFLNLLTNAIKFTEQGEVSMRLSQNGDTSDVVVADTGRGIAVEDFQRIFTKFERAGERDQKGSGLGLSITKAIVELHKGRIWVESQLGQGSRFVVRLPIQK